MSAPRTRVPPFLLFMINQIPLETTDTDINMSIDLHFRDFRNNISKVTIGNHSDCRFALLEFDSKESARQCIEQMQSVKIMFGKKACMLEPFSQGRNVFPTTSERTASSSRSHQHRRTYRSNRNEDETYSHVAVYNQESLATNSDRPPPGAGRGYNFLTSTKSLIQPNGRVDARVNRTLFIGNLDPDVRREDIESVFRYYGRVLDVDLKKKPSQMRNMPAFAFVKFQDMDGALKAAQREQGIRFGRTQCKLGFGKPTPSNVIWIGGLTEAAATPKSLVRECDRFGSVKLIDWPEGKHYAYVVFDSVEAAKFACEELKNEPFANSDHYVRVDYADTRSVPASRLARGETPMSRSSSRSSSRSRSRSRSRSSSSSSSNASEKSRSRSPLKVQPVSTFKEELRENGSKNDNDPDNTEKLTAQLEPMEVDPFAKPTTASTGKSMEQQERAMRQLKRLVTCTTVQQMWTQPEPRSFSDVVADTDVEVEPEGPVLSRIWTGCFSLKNNHFPAIVYLFDGTDSLASHLLSTTDSSGRRQSLKELKITQRLRLDSDRLEEIDRRLKMVGTSHFCFMIAAPPAPNDPSANPDPIEGVKFSALPQLVNYLKKKEAAGVVSLIDSNGAKIGLIHAFPPCPYVHELLKKKATSLQPDDSKDYLVIIAVKGQNA